MKFTEHCLFAALLIPTAAMLAAAVISFAVPESDVPESQTFQSELVAAHSLRSDWEEQP
jgi:hypothetical protein